MSRLITAIVVGTVVAAYGTFYHNPKVDGRARNNNHTIDRKVNDLDLGDAKKPGRGISFDVLKLFDINSSEPKSGTSSVIPESQSYTQQGYSENCSSGASGWNPNSLVWPKDVLVTNPDGTLKKEYLDWHMRNHGNDRRY